MIISVVSMLIDSQMTCRGAINLSAINRGEYVGECQSQHQAQQQCTLDKEHDSKGEVPKTETAFEV